MGRQAEAHEQLRVGKETEPGPMNDGPGPPKEEEMQVWIMKIIVSLLFALMGMQAAWCDSCGELYQAGQLQHVDGIGEACPDCAEYWEGC